MTALRDFMTTDVLEVSGQATVADAADQMVHGRCGSVLVMIGSTLVGILTERDVLRAAAARVDPSATHVRDWMTPDPVTATPSMDSADAAETMISQGFRHLPVVEDGRVLGIVSLRDVFSVRIGHGR